MPSLDRHFLNLLKDDYTKFPCFIETGTLDGGTTFAMEPLFNTVYTIEVSPTYYERTKSRYSGNKINFINGDSGLVFEDLLPTIEEKTIFFLDGHWSSGDTGKGEKDCPLIEELMCIAHHFTPEAIIIIDDYRLFGLNASSGIINEDWSSISKEKLLNIIQARIKDVYHLDSSMAENDRLIIHIRAKY